MLYDRDGLNFSRILCCFLAAELDEECFPWFDFISNQGNVGNFVCQHRHTMLRRIDYL